MHTMMLCNPSTVVRVYRCFSTEIWVTVPSNWETNHAVIGHAGRAGLEETSLVRDPHTSVNSHSRIFCFRDSVLCSGIQPFKLQPCKWEVDAVRDPVPAHDCFLLLTVQYHPRDGAMVERTFHIVKSFKLK